jgi:hypothetical protein
MQQPPIVNPLRAHPRTQRRDVRFGSGSVVQRGTNRHARTPRPIFEIEQGHHPERTGVEIVVDLDHITGRDSSGRFVMRRDE